MKDRLLLATSSGTDFYKQKRDLEKKRGGVMTTAEFTEIYEPTENATNAGTSIFDPVLCELFYKWFCPAAGTIIDPFAGGGVRGIVAHQLGYNYTGIELRPEQVQANIENSKEILPEENQPKWITGDSNKELIKLDQKFDLLFSCPPYANLEVYSDLPEDISNMKYVDFLNIYRSIILKSCALLNDNAFAVFVVSEIRNPKTGLCYGFVKDTQIAFEDCGLKLYNECCLINVAGSLPIRAGRQFDSGRKLGRMHQNVLIFLKGDSKKAVAKLGKIDFSYLEDDNTGNTQQHNGIEG